MNIQEHIQNLHCPLYPQHDLCLTQMTCDDGDPYRVLCFSRFDPFDRFDHNLYRGYHDESRPYVGSHDGISFSCVCCQMAIQSQCVLDFSPNRLNRSIYSCCVQSEYSFSFRMTSLVCISAICSDFGCLCLWNACIRPCLISLFLQASVPYSLVDIFSADMDTLFKNLNLYLGKMLKKEKSNEYFSELSYR